MNSSGMRRLLVLLTSLVLLLTACSGGGEEEQDQPATGTDQPGAAADQEPSEVERGTVVVGSTNFAEQEIVAELYALVLEDAGYTVERRYQLGSREVVFPALQGGELDVTPEYVGTLLEFLNGGAGEATSDTDETLELLNERLEEEDGSVTMLEPSEAQDKNALAVTGETAEELDLTQVSDLGEHASDMVLGGPPECPQRPLCLPGYERVYDLQFADFRALDAGGPLTAEALNEGDIDVGLVFSTQGAIAANDWVVLDDDQGLQPAENLTPAVRQDILNGEIEELLNSVSAVLTTETLIELNERVDVEGEAPADVAADFAESQGLLGGAGGATGGSEPTAASS